MCIHRNDGRELLVNALNKAFETRTKGWVSRKCNGREAILSPIFILVEEPSTCNSDNWGRHLISLFSVPFFTVPFFSVPLFSVPLEPQPTKVAGTLGRAGRSVNDALILCRRHMECAYYFDFCWQCRSMTRLHASLRQFCIANTPMSGWKEIVGKM